MVSKKQMNQRIVIGLVILAIAIFGIGNLTFSIFKPDKVLGSTESLVFENSNSALYILQVSAQTVSDCGSNFEQEFSFTVNSASNENTFENTVKLASNLQLGKEFKASSVSFIGLTAKENVCASTNVQRDLGVAIDELTALCRVDSAGMGDDNIPRARITCKVTGGVHSIDSSGNPSNETSPEGASGLVLFSYSGININLEVLKEGVECTSTQKQSCELTDSCVSNICTTSNQPTNYYRLENNECDLISLTPDQVTENDFLTLTECINNIGAPSTVPIVLILSGIGGVVGLLIWIRRR